MENYYVLFVKAGREEYVKTFLDKRLDSGKHFPFIPTKIDLFVRRGVTNKQKQVCFPGYVFIKSSYDAMDFILETSSLIKQIKDSYHFLYYGNKSEIMMSKEEQLYLRKLLGIDYCIQDSIGLIKGDKVIITSGPLMGLESSIKKINRHTREAFLEINIMGYTRQIAVALEIAEKFPK